MIQKIKEMMAQIKEQYGFDPDYVAALEFSYNMLILLHGEVSEHMEANEKEVGDSDLGMALLKIEPVLDTLKKEIDAFTLPEDYGSEG